MYCAQVLGDVREGTIPFAKPLQLRMVAIPFRVSPQHRLREQRLAPKGD